MCIIPAAVETATAKLKWLNSEPLFSLIQIGVRRINFFSSTELRSCVKVEVSGGPGLSVPKSLYGLHVDVKLNVYNTLEKQAADIPARTKKEVAGKGQGSVPAVRGRTGLMYA